jgi:hypothetical protein
MRLPWVSVLPIPPTLKGLNPMNVFNMRLRFFKSKQTQFRVMLFALGKGIGIAPADHFEIGKDVLAGGFSGFITPHLPDPLNPGQVMPLPAMTHSVRRLAGKLVQPQMYVTGRVCLKNRPAMGLRARRVGWRGATKEHIREKSVTEEQRRQPACPAARPSGIFLRHALRFAKFLLRFDAMLLEGGHFITSTFYVTVRLF